MLGVAISACVLFCPTSHATIDSSYVVCVADNPAQNSVSSFGNACPLGSNEVTVYRISIANPPPGFDPEYGDAWVAIPTRPTANHSNRLLVMLPGTNTASTANDGDTPYYSYLAERAAYNGYAAAIILPYPNTQTAGDVCGTSASTDTSANNSSSNVDSCYTNMRGELAFGQNTSYRLGASTYNATVTPGMLLWNHITTADSVINRLTLLLDTLSVDQPASTTADYWNTFLITGKSNSPYDNSSYSYYFGLNHYTGTGPGTGAYPNWPNIVIAGHSQGGAVAAFLMSTVPASLPKGVLFSAPQDSYSYGTGNLSASWIRQSNAGSRLWAIRHGQDASSSDEGNYGDQVEANWNAFGAGISPIPGTDQVLGINDNCLQNGGSDGNPTWNQRCRGIRGLSNNNHRYLLAQPLYSGAYLPDLNNHDTTAVNSLLTNGLTGYTVPTSGSCTTGATCSIFNPNQAYILDALLAPP